jgi:hypothetical protein
MDAVRAPMELGALRSDNMRIANMLSGVDAITAGKGSNCFLFVHATQLEGTAPLEVSWTTGKRQLIMD